jgi:phosphoribosylanthranilate isomerase
MTAIKICGMRRAEHAVAAAAAGADMLGFIFAPARRRISVDEAQAIAAAVRAHPAGAHTRLVGVFVNAAPAEMLATAQQCGLDMLQLSGDEPPEVASQLGALPLIKAVRLNDAAHEAAWFASAGERIRLLVDAHVAGSYGGAGVVADWDRAAALGRHHPILLAGGLTPENVGDAIAAVHPWSVDVSSGVETDGIKDLDKMIAFIEAVRSADRALAMPA